MRIAEIVSRAVRSRLIEAGRTKLLVPLVDAPATPYNSVAVLALELELLSAVKEHLPEALARNLPYTFLSLDPSIHLSTSSP